MNGASPDVRHPDRISPVTNMKRIAVFSDTHGNRNDMRDVLARFDGIDAMLHLGDGLADGEAVAREFGISFLGVAGNEDVASDCPRDRVVTEGNWRLLALHGDQFDIGFYDGPRKWDGNKGKLAALASLNGARVILFGHSHAALLEERDGVALCNPGDQYAGSQTGASFCLLDVSEEKISAALYVKESAGWKLSSSLELRA
jgi:hypothetical protein